MSRLRDRLRKGNAPERSRVQKLPEYEAGFFSTLIEQQDRKIQRSRLSEQGYTHLSSLIDACPRAHVLAHQDNMDLSETPKPQDRLMWAIGKAVEDHMRSQFILRVGFKGVSGEWSCPCGETHYEGLHQSITCTKCEKPADIYDEHVLVDDEAEIIASPDMVYEHPDDGRTSVQEFKSMNKKDFDALVAPKTPHVLQAGGYARLLAYDGYEVNPDVAILYGCKDYSFIGKPYKEFHVDVSTDAIDRMLDGMWEIAEKIKRGKRGRLPKKLDVCYNEDSPTARNCPCVVGCMSRRG